MIDNGTAPQLHVRPTEVHSMLRAGNLTTLQKIAHKIAIFNKFFVKGISNIDALANHVGLSIENGIRNELSKLETATTHTLMEHYYTMKNSHISCIVEGMRLAIQNLKESSFTLPAIDEESRFNVTTCELVKMNLASLENTQ